MKTRQSGRGLSKRDQLRGLEKAIESKRTKPWLKDSMRRFAERLRKEIAAEERTARQNRRHSFF